MQGCLLSPFAIFAMLVSPLALKLTAVSLAVTILLYADDLLVIISLPPPDTVRVLADIMSEMTKFSAHSGPHVNKIKFAILLRGDWQPQQRAMLSTLGIPMKSSYKYLGILLGHVTSEQSFSVALNKALSRAYAMRSWGLSLLERVELLKLWILPLLVHPARAVCPDNNVCSTLQLVYNVAIKLSSCRVTQPILSLPKEQGLRPCPTEDFSLLAIFSDFCTLPQQLCTPASLTSLLKSFRPFQTTHVIMLNTSDP